MCEVKFSNDPLFTCTSPGATAYFNAQIHYVKSVQMRSFLGPFFPGFGLNTGIYGPEKLRIWTLFAQ